MNETSKTATTLEFHSSRDKDIALGICIGRGYRVSKVRTHSMPMKFRVDVKLSKQQIEDLDKQVSEAYNI